MKKIGTILLLTILLLQAGGIFLIYKTQQIYVQQEMQQALNSEKTQFQKIILSFSDYQKNKINAHEISVKGKMYDVKSITVYSDSLELLVINDSKEKTILEKIKELTALNNGQNYNLPNQLQKLLSLSYLSPNTYSIFFICSLTEHVFLSPALTFISSDLDVSTPPPEFV